MFQPILSRESWYMWFYHFSFGCLFVNFRTVPVAISLSWTCQLVFRESSESSAFFLRPQQTVFPIPILTHHGNHVPLILPSKRLGFVFSIPSIRTMFRRQISDMYDCTFPHYLYMVTNWQFLFSHPCDPLVVALSFGLCVVEFVSYFLLQSQVPVELKHLLPPSDPMCFITWQEFNKASPNRHTYNWCGTIFHQLLWTDQIYPPIVTLGNSFGPMFPSVLVLHYSAWKASISPSKLSYSRRKFMCNWYSYCMQKIGYGFQASFTSFSILLLLLGFTLSWGVHCSEGMVKTWTSD